MWAMAWILLAAFTRLIREFGAKRRIGGFESMHFV
jgi:hypothetical protein